MHRFVLGSGSEFSYQEAVLGEAKKPNCHQDSPLGHYFVNKPQGVLLGGIYSSPFLDAKCSSVAGDPAAAILLHCRIDLAIDLRVTAVVRPSAFSGCCQDHGNIGVSGSWCG